MKQERLHRLTMLLRHGLLLCAISTYMVAVVPPAFSQEWILSLQEREKERDREKWYFSDHLSGKAQSKRMDLLYKFFLGSRTPKPRVELVGGGVGESTQLSLGSSTDSLRLGRQGVGYGGRIAFNNFVSGLTGLRTLNVVPQLSARLMQLSFASDESVSIPNDGRSADSERIAGGFRLVGENVGDTAIYVDYERRRAKLLQSQDLVSATSVSFETWLINLRAEIYLFPFLALTGSFVLDENAIETHRRSSSHEIEEFGVGGQIDLAMFRLFFDYIDRTYIPRETFELGTRNKEIVHTLGVSILF